MTNEFERGAYSEPDIYRDESEPVEPKVNLTEAVSRVRTIIAEFLLASNSDLIRLQVLMSLFAGYSLREISAINGKSHEYCRSVLLSIRVPHPQLFMVISTQRNVVSEIAPLFTYKRIYVVSDSETGATTKHRSLADAARRYGITYREARKWPHKRTPYRGRFTITARNPNG